MQKKNNTLKIVAGVFAGLLVGAFAGGFYFDDSAEVSELQSQIAVLENQPVPEAEIVEVPVDSENLEVVLDSLYVNKNSLGYLELLTEDLDDDEVDQIVDRIVFINEVASLAANAVERLDIADELEDFNSTLVDEDEVERIRVQDDAGEIVVFDADFEDKDATVIVKVEFEQDDVDYVAEFEVKVRDGEVDDIEVTSVELKD